MAEAWQRAVDTHAPYFLLHRMLPRDAPPEGVNFFCWGRPKTDERGAFLGYEGALLDARGVPSSMGEPLEVRPSRAAPKGSCPYSKG